MMNPEQLWAKSNGMTSPITRPCGSRGTWRTSSRQRRACSTRPATSSFGHSDWTRSDTGTDCDGAYGWQRRFTISARRTTIFRR